MPFHADHNLLEVQCGNVASALWIFAFERFHGVFLVEVVQQLTEFSIVDQTLFFLAEIALHK